MEKESSIRSVWDEEGSFPLLSYSAMDKESSSSSEWDEEGLFPLLSYSAMEKEISSPLPYEDCLYRTIKDFSFFGQRRTILLHNGNGLDSLLAICNALTLRGDLVLEDETIEEWELQSVLRNKIEDLCPETLKDSLVDVVSRIQELHDYHPILKVLQIPLYHGCIISDKKAEPNCFDETEQSGSSITEDGLYNLIESIQNQQIIVLVDNDGMHTATKKTGELYLLVTEKSLNDVGILWQKVNGGSLVGEDLKEATESSSDEEEEGFEEEEEGFEEEEEIED